jgi:hypothetical protein
MQKSLRILVFGSRLKAFRLEHGSLAPPCSRVSPSPHVWLPRFASLVAEHWHPELVQEARSIALLAAAFSRFLLGKS